MLSNGRYHVMITNAGGGYSRWKDLAVTRWREDSTCDNWGTFCYIRDVDSGKVWSNTLQPTLAPAEGYEATFTEPRVEFRRRDEDIETHTDIAVSPEDDIELRRMRITNRSRDAQHDRGDELCRGRAGPGDRRQHASRVQQPVCAKPRSCSPRPAILCTRRPRSNAALAVDAAPDGDCTASKAWQRRLKPIACVSSAAATALRLPRR